MESSITFVSLGPGEPELITLKALKVLRQADIIYCPSTLSKSGKQLSRSADILHALDIPSGAIHLFMVPMSKQRDAALEVYDNVRKEAVIKYKEGKQIVIVAEGDSGFYSSIHYIYDKFIEDGIPVKRLAGIPAFIAAGALAGLHIVKQEEKLIVLPGIVSQNELNEYLKNNMTVVIMKLSQCANEIQEYIRCNPQHTYHYFENVGTEKEYYSYNRNELLGKTFPYFSLMIIKPYVLLNCDVSSFS